MKRRRRRRVYFQKEKAEIDEDYEYNTGRIIAEYFKDTERSGSGASENLAQTEHYLACRAPCVKITARLRGVKPRMRQSITPSYWKRSPKWQPAPKRLMQRRPRPRKSFKTNTICANTAKTYITGKQKKRRYRKHSSGRP